MTLMRLGCMHSVKYNIYAPYVIITTNKKQNKTKHGGPSKYLR